ncbi:hypothetical protein SLS60_002000 [Paraconiothyrium brasiliense]|uniref:Uncharacterized protein n=1 Tax=Paraconiothyrium brasiliense TaxID=300254 RepID=A0ABR3S1Z0_9PLEO
MTGSSTGEGLGNAIKKGVGRIHVCVSFLTFDFLAIFLQLSIAFTHNRQGTGEAIRGNFNAAVDSATGDREAAQRQQNIASRGMDEFEKGHYHGTGAGVTPVDTDRERVNRAAQGESVTVGSTNHGPHGTNVGNKLDPRFDSDLDNRGTCTGNTNVGSHSTNVGNGVAPRVEDGENGLKK